MEPGEVRSLFPITRKRSYLFSGGMAPASTRTRRAVDRFVQQLTEDPGTLFRQRDELTGLVRRLFARLIGADENEIAVTDSTSTGSNMAVEMIEAPPGSNVVFDDLAYPSSVYPWMLPPRAHVERRFVSRRSDGLIHPEDLAMGMDGRTVAVSVSHVSQETGFRHDIRTLARMAHERGALLIVDAMQSVGALALDVHESEADFLSCGAMKWLLGAPGLGFFYAAGRHLGQMPCRAGYAGAVRDTNPWGKRMFRPKQGAGRFELGMPNLMGLAASAPGLEILLDVGMKRVEAHLLDLSGCCIEGLLGRGLNVLTPRAPQHRAGIVSVQMSNAPGAFQHMRDRGVDTYCREGSLRVDSHIFNNRDDIARFLSELDGCLGRGRKQE